MLAPVLRWPAYIASSYSDLVSGCSCNHGFTLYLSIKKGSLVLVINVLSVYVKHMKTLLLTEQSSMSKLIKQIWYYYSEFYTQLMKH